MLIEEKSSIIRISGSGGDSSESAHKYKYRVIRIKKSEIMSVIVIQQINVLSVTTANAIYTCH